MKQCPVCGKILPHRNVGGVMYLVEEKADVLFRPDVLGDEVFICEGRVRKGYRDSDGLRGQKVHSHGRTKEKDLNHPLLARSV